MTAVPKEFRFSMRHGIPAPHSRLVVLEGGRLMDGPGSDSWGSEPDPEPARKNPGEEEWARFRQTIERIGVFEWQESYDNPCALDDGGWSCRTTGPTR
jgi:hypothetical protein